MNRFTFFDDNTPSTSKPAVVNKPIAEISDFEKSKEARYRIEQQNLIKIDGNIISSTGCKRQYHFLINNLNQTGFIKLEESHLDFGNTTLKSLAYFINKTDELTDEIKFKLNDKGKPVQIINEDYLKARWIYFKTNEMPDDPFVKEINDFDPQKVADMIKAGDDEFSNFELMKKNLEINLFYNIILDQYLFSSNYENFAYDNKTVSSHLFNTQIDLSFASEVLSETEDTLTIKKTSNIVFANLHDIATQYQQHYQPTIQYNFTNFDYLYEQSVIINKNDGLIDSALATVSETVKNNIESIAVFKLTRIKL